MQTFNIDISRKNGPLVLYAKQGDSLSRFFKIVFLQDGSPWEPPAGALFSVRFGAPGMPDGWYDTIKEPDGSTHSAFSLKDNALTVELAYEAVSKAGTNTLAVLVLDANGYQLGMWNLSLQVELTPGENSPEADVYYSLLSEQVAQVLQAKDDAQASAILSQSWAVGGTSSRAGEDTNNSKYWSDEAKKSAQESLGFRTFFSSVRPDLNGDLDPSSPMFAGTGASITVRSAANRIENVTSHGFTEQAGTGDASPTNIRPIKVGGMKLVELVITGDEEFYGVTNQYCNITITTRATKFGRDGKAFCNKLPYIYNVSLNGFYLNNAVAIVLSQPFMALSDGTVQGTKKYCKKLYEAGTPLIFWYYPENEDDATGIYTPQISDGESYSCECIEIQQYLCEGDTVDGNVPYEGEQKCVERHVRGYKVFTGTEGFGFFDSSKTLFINISDAKANQVDTLKCSAFNPSFATKQWNCYINSSKNLIINGYDSLEAGKNAIKGLYDAGTPVQIEYDLATPVIYTSDPVDLPADPITTATQATLEEPAANTPMLLAQQGEVGTYTVSGEKTISLYIKALIKDGDAATLGGNPPEYFLPADQPAVSAPKSSKPTFAVNYGRIVSPDNSGLYLRNADRDGAGIFVGVREDFQSLTPDHNTSGGSSNLGAPSYRWRIGYFVNQPDVLSDQNMKEQIEPLSEKQMLFFDALKPVQYKLKGGSHDRLHYGFIAQEVEQAMAAAGISDMEFGGFCKDRKIKVVRQYSEEGELIGEAEEELEGYEYSLRYGEFIALNTAAIQAMKKEISELKAEINKLKGV